MPKKFVLVLLDGLGDRSHPALDNKTPLQAARTPFMDHIAEKGCNGLYHASFQGQALPSENAHFAMFGYDQKDFPGRGVLEALGGGIKLEKDQVAVLTHFVSVAREGNRLRLVRDKMEADPVETRQAFAAVDSFKTGEVDLSLVPTRGLFGIILQKGYVSPFITDSNPILDGLLLSSIKPLKDYAHDPASIESARAMTAYLSWAYKKLRAAEFNLVREKSGRLPLNALVTQRAGRLKEIVPFSRKNGIRGLSVSSGVVYAGLGTYLGLDVIKGLEHDHPGEEIKARINTARVHLHRYDFIHVHTKAPDEAGHKKDPLLKKQAIELLDQGLAESLPAIMDDSNVIVAVTADHSTPSSGPLVHSGEPVPLVIAGEGVRVDKVRKFDEVSAAGGGLGFVRGREFMYLVLNCLERSKLVGLMDEPEDHPYWPGKGEPFVLES